MLSYAFLALREQGYKSLATEQFHNMEELCAAILSKGVSLQLKRGLGREYILKTEPLSTLRGKINISDSIKTNTLHKQQLICSFDEFTVDSPMNRIIKTTMIVLLHSHIDKKRKKELRKLLVFFGEVEQIDVHAINWRMQYNRNNQTYRLIIGICNLVLKGLLQTNQEGNTKLMDFLDEQQRSRLFEKFILEYYRKEVPQITANPSQIYWQLDDGFNEMLPVMRTDIMLSYGRKTLIIDAKYYSRVTQVQHGTHKLHSANLYQIFSYVKNKEIELGGTPHKVSGMLIYAKTNDNFTPNHTYKMSGNQISAKTLDLDCAFPAIKGQLNSIVQEYFDIVVS